MIIDKRSPESHHFSLPLICPSCGFSCKLEGEVALRCFNARALLRKASLSISYQGWISVMWVHLVEHLLKWGLVENVATIFVTVEN